MVEFYKDNLRTIYQGDCRNMSEVPDESVHCVVTSPPYWGLRKYEGNQELIWGSDDKCEHQWGQEIKKVVNPQQDNSGGMANPIGRGSQSFTQGTAGELKLGNFCSLCGAWRGQFGLEPTPELYVQHTVEILREVKRVLRKDGVVFWNIGDSYATHQSGGKNSAHNFRSPELAGEIGHTMNRPYGKAIGLKPKDLCLIPSRVALAAQEDGWWVRSVIIWEKKNPMPESMRGWTFVRHRVTIKEYERLQSLRSTKSGNQNRSSNLPNLSQSQIFDCQETLSTEREGASDSEGKGREGRCEGETPSILSFPTRTTEQAEISTNVEGQANDDTPGTELQSKAIEGSGDSNSRRLAGSPKQSQIQMLLLREEKAKTYDGSRNTIEQGGEAHQGEYSASLSELQLKEVGQDSDALVACPGCEKCLPNDGLVLRKGSWRPTNSYEFILMLTKSKDYYSDADAVREQNTEGTLHRLKSGKVQSSGKNPKNIEAKRWGGQEDYTSANGRNLRDCWTFPTSPFSSQFVNGEKLDHFAVFPEKLPELCIKAATSEKGCCPKCGAPWARVIDKKPSQFNIRVRDARAGRATPEEGYKATEEEIAKYPGNHPDMGSRQTLGWRPTCNCKVYKLKSSLSNKQLHYIEQGLTDFSKNGILKS